MPFNEYLIFLGSIGWLVALMMVAVLPSLPAGFGRRHVGWLFAFCGTRVLAEIVTLLLGATPAVADHTWRPFVAIVSGMVLWEFARRVWNEQGRRRLSAATHLIGAECLAVVAAVALALGDAARPAWLTPIGLAATLLPGVLGFTSGLLLWSCLGRDADVTRRGALRVAALAFGAFAFFSEMPDLSAGEVLPPWIAVGGLGVACVALPAARTRFTTVCATGLFLAVVLGPFATGASVASLASAQLERLRADGRAAAALQGGTAAALESTPLPEATALTLRQHRQHLRATDPLLREVTVWKLRGDRIHSLALAEGSADAFRDTRGAFPAEIAGVSRARNFVHPTLSTVGDRGVVTVHLPLRAATFETPAAWLALEYPQAPWSLQRQHAQRGGLALCGALAAFCAIGFVLAVRHALENAQHLAIERAQSADKAKTEFLAFLSHEMRTPLQTILGRTELLQREAGATDASRRHGAAIENQGRLLLRLVTDLLDLGTLEAGKFQLRPHPFSLRTALAAVEDTIRAPAAAKQLALEFDVAPDVPDALVGDEARLRQILGNILGNAVKYTNAGTVTLRVRRDTPAPIAQLPTLNSQLVERLRFDVTDTGPGLPPDKIPQLFTLFTRLDSGDTFTREGTGVGLALVRRLCELMGGTATAANRPEGGAAFTVRLAFPLDPSAGVVPAAAAADDPAGTHGLRVLVAEDNAAAREFLLEALRSLGHRAEGAADGPAALAAATIRRFDAVLLDVNLPGRDGISIARTLATQPNRPRLIGCSAEAFAHTREAALAAGMDAFLEKPVALAALAGALGAGPAAPVVEGNLFARLQGPAVAARTRALLVSEWPLRHAAAAAALAQGDAAPVGALLHYVHSSARLAADDALLALCRPFDAGDAAIDPAAARDRLAALDQHVRGFASRT